MSDREGGMMHKSHLSVCVLAIACALTAGCGTTRYAATAPTNKATIHELSKPTDFRSLIGDEAAPQKIAGETQPQPNNLLKLTNLTPLSTYDDQWTQNPHDGASFSGAYTRLLILSDLAADGGNGGATEPRIYKERYWWWRAIVGQDFSINLTAKVKVGALESTIPLTTIGHQSNSDGEQWSRVVHHSKMNFPLFLVKSDGSSSVPVVNFSVKGTKSYASRGAATAIQVALGVAKASGTTASVITKLSEQSTKAQARAIDEAVSKLFGSGIVEEHWTDRDLRAWSVSDKNQLRGVKIKFRIPSSEQDWNSEPLDVGSWIVTFDYPRPSIFSDWRICGNDTVPRCARTRADAEKLVHKEINPSEVLNYTLVDGDHGLGTIRAYLSQQDWYISAQTALTNQTTARSTASSLCRRIANEITGLGLNGFDAEAVVWAVVKRMPLPDTAPDFATIDDCKTMLSSIERDRT